MSGSRFIYFANFNNLYKKIMETAAELLEDSETE